MIVEAHCYYHAENDHKFLVIINTKTGERLYCNDGNPLPLCPVIFNVLIDHSYQKLSVIELEELEAGIAP